MYAPLWADPFDKWWKRLIHNSLAKSCLVELQKHAEITLILACSMQRQLHIIDSSYSLTIQLTMCWRVITEWLEEWRQQWRPWVPIYKTHGHISSPHHWGHCSPCPICMRTLRWTCWSSQNYIAPPHQPTSDMMSPHHCSTHTLHSNVVKHLQENFTTCTKIIVVNI